MSSASHFARPLTITSEPVPGVNLVGFLEAESGLGEVARRLGRTLEHVGIPFEAIAYRRTPSRLDHHLELPSLGRAAYDTNLICLNADTVANFARDAGAEFFAHRYSVGVWFWETDRFPAESGTALRYLDEIWVASDYARDAISPVSDVPVHVVPIPFEEPPAPSMSREQLGLPDRFTFLFLFDFVSADRKNPLAVVDAYKRAFRADDGAALVLKSINGRERKPHKLAELSAAAGERADILIRDGYVSSAERDSYVAACDCFVSLHRSEGFGLALAEAQAYGKPVIATGYSGNLEFMDAASSYLVPYRLVPIPPAWWAASPGAEWADPDIPAASTLMRRVFEHPEDARNRGRRARAELLRSSSFERAGEFVSARLEEARARRSQMCSAGDVRKHVVGASQHLYEGTTKGNESSGHPAAFLRRFLIRALWPELERQRRLDSDVLDALTALERGVTALTLRVAALESRTTPGDRREIATPEETGAATPTPEAELLDDTSSVATVQDGKMTSRGWVGSPATTDPPASSDDSQR